MRRLTQHRVVRAERPHLGLQVRQVVRAQIPRHQVVVVVLVLQHRERLVQRVAMVLHRLSRVLRLITVAVVAVVFTVQTAQPSLVVQRVV